MAVRVFIKRRFEPHQETELFHLIAKLRAISTAQPGYVSGETLTRVDAPGQSLVISKWKTMEYWRTWLSNPQRTAIQERMDALLNQPTQIEVYDFR